MGGYQLVVYGISKICIVVCVGLFIRPRYGRRWTNLCLCLGAAVLLGMEYLRYVLALHGIHQRLTNLAEILGLAQVLYLSEKRNWGALFTGILACVYGTFGIMLGKIGYAWGAPPVLSIAVVTAVDVLLLLALVFWLRPAYWRLQEACEQDWRLLCVMLGTFLLELYLLYGALKSSPQKVRYYLAPVISLMAVYLLVIIVFRMMDRLRKEEVHRQMQSVLAVSEATLRQEMDEIQRMERRLAEYNHDYRHMLRMLNGMLAESNYEGMKTALEQMQEPLRLIEPRHCCDNMVINGVLIYFIRKLEEIGGTLHIAAQVPESLGDYEWEIGIVLGNLLQDAVHSCAQLPKQNRNVYVKARQAGVQTMLELRYLPAGTMSFEKETGLPVSARGEGLDMRSVADRVRAWGGQLDCGMDGEWFFLRILT